MKCAVTTPLPMDPTYDVGLQLNEIQGNILAGFNNDHQRFLFLRVDFVEEAKAWLKTWIPKIATTDVVKKSNDAMKAAIAKSKADNTPAPKLTAKWMNLAFNHPGLLKLGFAHVDEFPDEFTQGMAARSTMLGDVGPHAPEMWDPWLQERDFLHIMITLSADQLGDLNALMDAVMASLPKSGLTLMHTLAGENPDMALTGGISGIEHFGFKDGISQPGVKGFTVSTGTDSTQGQPGQDLLWPGEFVLGYPTQVPDRPTPAGLNPNKGPISINGPEWTKNGSFLVFRKLQQDVAGFRNSIHYMAKTLPVSPEVLGAKIVGRFRSGCPMELTDGSPAGLDTNDGDPSGPPGNHGELLCPEHIVDFEYGDDTAGTFLPRAGHIRKAYPRDEQMLKSDGKTEDEDQDELHESRTQTHRILRRGIPFGVPLPITANGLTLPFVDDQISRGLLFFCFQSSIKRQFEFIQTQWINNPNFPQAGDGADPVMSQVKTAPMKCPIKGMSEVPTIELKHYVTTNGGEYFFAPSISAMTDAANAASSGNY